MTVELISGLIVSRETIEDLKTFEKLVMQWTKKINLISKNSIDQIWSRHICDSVQLDAYKPKGISHWVDLGSGGGFPGIVIAILSKHHNPQVKFTLIESDLRKSVFLRTVSRKLSLSVNVVSERIETIQTLQADVISARALMPLNGLLALTNRHLKENGLAMLPKGVQVENEIIEAKQNWDFDLEKKQSIIDESSSILLVRRIVSLDTK